MTSKKKLKRRIRQLEKSLSHSEQRHAVTRRKWINGDAPTWLDRVRSDDTPLLNRFTRTVTIGDFTTEEGIAGEA